MSHKWGLTSLPSTVWSPIKNIPTIINYLFIVVSWNSVPRSLHSIIWLRARACVFMWTRALLWKCHRSLPCSCTRRSGCGAMTPYWSLGRENKQMPQGKPHLSTRLRAVLDSDWILRMPLCTSLYIAIVFLKNIHWGWLHFAHCSLLIVKFFSQKMEINSSSFAIPNAVQAAFCYECCLCKCCNIYRQWRLYFIFKTIIV